MQNLEVTLEQKLKSGRLTLPSLPENAVKLRRIASDPNSSIKDISDLIGQDASISAQIIRLAQTLRYSNPGCTITSLSKAIGRIGMQGSINLVLAMSILQGYHFHSKFIHGLCKKENEQSRLICKYALTIFEIIENKLPQNSADFISLGSIFLNIGCLPIFGELDAIERVTQIKFDESVIFNWCNLLKVKLGQSILESWKFDKKFSLLLTKEITPEYSLEMKVIIYALRFIEHCSKDQLYPLSNDMSDNFCTVPEGKYRDLLIEYLKDCKIL